MADKGKTMRISSGIMYPLILLIVFSLAGCYPANGGSHAKSTGIPLPAGLLSLPGEGTMSVKVFMDDEVAPRFSDTIIGGDAASVTLEFSSPEGTRTFTVIFEYIDPEFAREGALPWELARWTSSPVEVTAGESLSLNVSDYAYGDTDDDGVSNAVELAARTDPGDPDDPGIPGDPVDPVDTVDPVTPVEPIIPPADPVNPVVIFPDGIWRGETQGQTIIDVLAILHGNRIMMTAGDLIYDGNYNSGSQGNFTGSVDVYTTSGEILTPLARIAINGNRPDETSLTLNLATSGKTVLPQRISFILDAAYERDSALALIAQMWSITTDKPRYTLTFPIDSNGTITGASDTDGCLYAGNLDTVDTQYNVYRVALSLVNQKKNACEPFTGSVYTGLASLVPDNDSMLIIVSNESHALSFELDKTGSSSTGNPRNPRSNPNQRDNNDDD